MFSYKLRCKQMHIYKAYMCIDSFVCIYNMKKNADHYIKGYICYYKSIVHKACQKTAQNI